MGECVSCGADTEMEYCDDCESVEEGGDEEMDEEADEEMDEEESEE